MLVRKVAGRSWQSCFQGQSLYEGLTARDITCEGYNYEGHNQLGYDTSLAHLGFGVPGDRIWGACRHLGVIKDGDVSPWTFSIPQLWVLSSCKPAHSAGLQAQHHLFPSCTASSAGQT